MVVRKGKYGPFLACSGYPKCKNIVNIPKENVKTQQRESGDIINLTPPPSNYDELPPMSDAGFVFDNADLNK